MRNVEAYVELCNKITGENNQSGEYKRNVNRFFCNHYLWWFYNSILYLAIKTSAGNTKKVPTRISQALLFGFMATIVKMGLDAITEVIIGTLNNMLVGVLIMGVIAVTAIGVGVTLFMEAVYQSNIFGIQNKIDEIGSHIDRGIENVKSWFENKFKKVGEGCME